MEIWDDDPQTNGDDLIDQYNIPILDMISTVHESEPTVIQGVKEIGKLTIAYYSLTTDQLVPSSCSSANSSTTTTTSKNSCDC